MPDEMDRVQELAQERIDDALAEHKRRKPARFSLETCCVCGADIPIARQLAMPGCCKCITCQMEWEMMHKKQGGM